ncbi:uncharacterized protein J7T54_006603 [Emericellopsis cladophorae]|uniref:Vegetative cell wall protein gp1 n=1 Tax=Emericellopsis cladophorae TaxID=2686198 RepID=A0A9P9Y6N3_9HYPO|nr:uncharacterized protein J7T54_006603 [Emericellopsis cladophorae]KAI6784558.1 hypothetical protein J7T54_006603 [Emericellopsis cladophorae]
MYAYQSPRTPGSTPDYEYDDWEFARMNSATPTPSPRQSWVEAQRTPQRPSTRIGHSRHSSYSASAFSPRPPRDSPRYNSSGEYATVDVSYEDFPSRGPSKSFHHRFPSKDIRSSFAHVRSFSPHDESEDDEVIEALRRTNVLPAQSRSRSRRYTNTSSDYDRVRYTDRRLFSQESPLYNEPAYTRHPAAEVPRPMAQARAPTSHSHTRRASAAMGRSATARPQQQPPSKSDVRVHRAATQLDADRHQIPVGYSLKNWDPREEPILLLGSVFDANSLGKWIYDWAVYSVGPRAPIAEMAGELWLLLLDLTEKTNKCVEEGLKTRTKESRQIVNDQIDGSERLMKTLRLLLKNCEAPMLKAASKKKSGLGKNAGTEFVDTLFGRDRELPRVEKFMQKVRTWSIRYEANVAPLLLNPTK